MTKDIQLARIIRGQVEFPGIRNFPTVPFDYALTRIEYVNGTAGDSLVICRTFPA